MTSNAQTAETSNYMFSLNDIKTLIKKSTTDEDKFAYVKVLSKLEYDLTNTIEQTKVDEIKGIIEEQFKKQSSDEELELLTNPTYNEIINKIFIGPFTVPNHIYNEFNEVINTSGNMIDYIIDLGTNSTENKALDNIPNIKITFDVDTPTSSEKTFSNIMDIIIFVKNTDRNYLIQDTNGDNESVIFTTIFLMINYDMTLVESLIFIKNKRLLSNPQDKYFLFLVRYENLILSQRT
jgi:hypothetical protein